MRSTTPWTSTTAPVSGSTKVRPLNVSTYCNGIGWPVSCTSVARSAWLATRTSAVRVASIGTPAATSEGFSWSKVSERGSGTVADRAPRYASVTGTFVPAPSKATRCRPSIDSVASVGFAGNVVPISSLNMGTERRSGGVAGQRHPVGTGAVDDVGVGERPGPLVGDVGAGAAVHDVLVDLLRGLTAEGDAERLPDEHTAAGALTRHADDRAVDLERDGGRCRQRRRGGGVDERRQRPLVLRVEVDVGGELHEPVDGDGLPEPGGAEEQGTGRDGRHRDPRPSAPAWSPGLGRGLGQGLGLGLAS